MGEDYRKVLQQGFETGSTSMRTSASAPAHIPQAPGASVCAAELHRHARQPVHAGTRDGPCLHSTSPTTTSPLDAEYVIFVAEVASTCNGPCSLEYLLGKTTDKKERAYLINHFLEQFRTTLYRQTMFAEFELNVGRMAQEGTSLTPGCSMPSIAA